MVEPAGAPAPAQPAGGVADGPVLGESKPADQAEPYQTGVQRQIETLGESEVQARSFSSSSEYVRQLVREKRDEVALRSKLVDGLASAPSTRATTMSPLSAVDCENASGDETTPAAISSRAESRPRSD